MKYLLDAHQKSLAEFINSQLWAEVKTCMRDRAPEKPDVKDPSHVAAAKGHQRAAFEHAIETIEGLPFDHDTTPSDPFARPAVMFTED